MAIDWGSYSGAIGVGIEVTQSPSSISNSTTSVTLTAEYYVRTKERFVDNQTMTLSGSISGIIEYSLSSDEYPTVDVKKIATRTISVSTSYSSESTKTFTAKVSGVYNGSSPSNTVSHTVKKRPIETPSAPGWNSSSSPSSSSIALDWSAPSSNGGASVTAYHLQVSESSSFGTIKYTNGDAGGSETVSGLTRNTTYYARVRAKNSAGWGGWSSTRSVKTLSTVPDKPAKPIISSIDQTTATVNYVAPNNGGAAITDWDIQLSPVSNFSSGVKEFNTGSATGLTPGTLYYVRVRAQNSVGESSWSDNTVSFITLSGAMIRVSGSYRLGKVFIKVDGTYRIAKVWKKINGAWRL